MQPTQNSATSIFQGRADRLETRRLVIAPLTREEFELYLTDVQTFARVLGLTKAPEEPNDETRRALNWLLDLGLQYDKKSSVWAALWTFVDKKLNVVVGKACFKGEPIDGDAEIAYETEREFRRRGYMTEGVEALVDWGRERDDLRGIVAETLKTNLPSQRVLEQVGFVRLGDEQSEKDAYFWRIDLQ